MKDRGLIPYASRPPACDACGAVRDTLKVYCTGRCRSGSGLAAVDLSTATEPWRPHIHHTCPECGFVYLSTTVRKVYGTSSEGANDA